MSIRFRPRTLASTVCMTALASTAIVAAAHVGGTASSTVSTSSASSKIETVEVDIAENGTKFVIDEAPVFDDGMPAYGNPFITQGYIYPAGTLDDSNGVNADGSAQFPDRVLGQWLCRGYFIGDGAHTTEGSWVYTTQLFSFGAHPDTGAETLVVTGYEGAEVGAEVTGAITGGTGAYATARGEATQELLGINNPELPTMGINKQVSLEVTR